LLILLVVLLLEGRGIVMKLETNGSGKFKCEICYFCEFLFTKRPWRNFQISNQNTEITIM